MKGELVNYQTKDGLKLTGFLAKSGKPSDKVLIHVFGMEGDFFQSNAYKPMQEKAESAGFDLFLSGNRGLGLLTSFNKKNKRVIIGTAKENFKDCVFDISASVSLLSKLGYSQIFISGHSTGCQKIIYYNHVEKNNKLKGVILISPVDDYNSTVQDLGVKFKKAVATARKMVQTGRGGEFTPKWVSSYTANRFLSYADHKNVEARILNYDSKLKEFSEIKCPVLSVFGSKDEYIVKPLRQCLKTLEKHSSSEFNWVVIKGGDHNFTGKEKQLASVIFNWLDSITKRYPKTKH
jgi:pimeloyl-ACP methyl ester carboxylesterase